MHSKRSFSILVVIFCLLISTCNIFAAKEFFPLLDSDPNLKEALAQIHKYYDERSIYWNSLESWKNWENHEHAISNIKKTIAGIIISNFNWIDSITFSTEIGDVQNIFEQAIKSGVPTRREITICFIDYLLNQDSMNEYDMMKDLKDCEDMDDNENNKDLEHQAKEKFAKFEAFLIDLCLTSIHDENIFIRRAAYDFFNKYFYNNGDKLTDPSGKFTDKFRDGLNDQDLSIQVSALHLLEIKIRKTRFCNAADFEVFKQAVYDKSEIIKFCGLKALSEIATLGFFVQEIFDIATELFLSNDESKVHAVSRLLDGVVNSAKNIDCVANKAKDFLKDPKTQEFGCLICARLFGGGSCFRLCFPERKNHFIWGKFNSGDIEQTVPANFDPSITLQDVKPLLISLIDKNFVTPLFERATPEKWYMSARCYGVRFWFFLELFDKLRQYYSSEKSSQEQSLNQQQIEEGAKEYVNSNSIDMILVGLSWYKYLVKNNVLNEEILLSLKTATKHCSNDTIYNDVMLLCHALVSKKYGIKEVSEIAKTLCFSCINRDGNLLDLCYDLSKYPEFFETALEILWHYTNFGGIFICEDDAEDDRFDNFSGSTLHSAGLEKVGSCIFRHFAGEVIDNCVESKQHLDELKDFAQKCMENYKNMCSISLGGFIYEELIEKGLFLDECAAFIKHMREVPNANLQTCWSGLYGNLVRKKSAFDDATEYARFLMNGIDNDSLHKQAAFDYQVDLVCALVSNGHAIQEGHRFLEMVKNANNGELPSQYYKLKNELEYYYRNQNANAS